MNTNVGRMTIFDKLSLVAAVEGTELDLNTGRRSLELLWSAHQRRSATKRLSRDKARHMAALRPE